jgi:hypothetical protein
MKGRILSLVVCAGLFGCGQDTDLRVVGGGSDQPNKVDVVAAGRILNQDGTPASGASVVAWSAQWMPAFLDTLGKPFDSTQTDADGRWSLRVPDSTKWYVTAKSGGFRTYSLPGQSEARLTAEARIQGSVRSNTSVRLESMWVAGTGESIELHWNADSSATFSQSTLTGVGRIWGKLRWNGGSETVLLADRFFQAGENPDLIIDPDTGNVLLASAESRPLGSALRGVDFDANDTDFGRWFHTIDQSWGGNSSIEPAEFPDVDSALQTDDLGKYFSWTFRLGDRLVLANNLTADPWAGIGLRLSTRDLDWSGVKALRLWVRGSSSQGDSIWLQVNTTAVDRIGGGQFRTAVHLPSGWSTMDIPLDALHMHAPTGSKADSLHYDWNTVKRSVHDIVFFAASPNLNLELREVRAIGARQIRW